ncbi:undecaprenyldiphospho-muramoylpentapeptide beta-N-acetylglucosaminyltransferase [Methylotenera sp.]|uniref:undecaprenyldiphospho-muramoylpentapeptide beta-N-acetylglucosaminyltransferase n=1 Tax=Methylotenera sp. TaxID=2051956 RepID=UPI0027234980|nr:undecaprenyldiphospho-muramoylpentapeptide beta-N-acetylglucosaminyltransferase [Methylotenera sp.]MDO9206396.1 undecaprenyldiphospho-muramoylpentapeptide beta-N-acetylglucosaminyltransferase [Methylotenera sp.]MDP3307319.1 undecaprenyldiphospho-muramoylpentapeptide beta-N-acetylglucosaminyltransferase [Methylotenera sp.]
MSVALNTSKKTLMVMAGGTGGHVYPAMAVADYLKIMGWKIVWLCTEGGMENRLIEKSGYEKAMITMQGVRGKGLMGWLLLPVKLAKAFAQSTAAIRKHQPNVVLGMGGFAAFPGGLMARLLGRPLVIHEQNSVAGLTNKVLAKFATQVLAAFPAAFANNAKLVGNPVRADIATLAKPEVRFAEREGALRLLVVGGSLGAKALNEALPQALAQLPVVKRPQVIHQAGIKHIEALKNNYEKAGVAVDARAFIDDMASIYAWADFVICRSGALTVAEVSAVGLGSLMVPFPFAVDDHQTTNAAYLSEQGAALVLQQKELSVEKLVKILSELNREKCLDMAIKARALGKPEATENVAKICIEVAR